MSGVGLISTIPFTASGQRQEMHRAVAEPRPAALRRSARALWLKASTKCLNLNRIGCNKSYKVVYWSSQSPDKKLYRGDVNPRFGARDRSLEILCQAAVSIEPSQGSFDDPAARQQLKAGSVSGAFDDLDGPLAEFGECLTQVGAVVDAVGEEMA